jgi:hypothetical protein
VNINRKNEQQTSRPQICLLAIKEAIEESIPEKVIIGFSEG